MPAHSEINPALLDQLNGQRLPGGVKIKVVQKNHDPSDAHFHQQMREAQQAVTLARTCKEMQEMIARNGLRLRVKCHMNGKHNDNSIPLVRPGR